MNSELIGRADKEPFFWRLTSIDIAIDVYLYILLLSVTRIRILMAVDPVRDIDHCSSKF